MPPISEHKSSSLVKLLLIADSGAGKTGALASLAAAGFHLRILDFDNGLDILRSYATRTDSPYVKQCSTIADNIDFLTCTDPMRNIAGQLFPLKSVAWQRAMLALDHWKDGTRDLGKVTSWDASHILVLDSLSTCAEAARTFHLSMNGKLGQTLTQNEGRRTVGAAQELLRSLLRMLYSDSIQCNVIVTSHITLVTESGLSPQAEGALGESSHGYPSAIGRALSPHIPRYFNSVLFADVAGSGASAKHYIYTQSQGNVLVKTSSPLGVKAKYPLETGLADYFKDVKGQGAPLGAL